MTKQERLDDLTKRFNAMLAVKLKAEQMVKDAHDELMRLQGEARLVESLPDLPDASGSG